MFILGITLIVAGFVLAYRAGAADQEHRDHEAQQVAAQYEAALAPSRRRHPSGRAS